MKALYSQLRRFVGGITTWGVTVATGVLASPLELAGLGHFYVGGHSERFPAQDGENSIVIELGQTYVQYVRLAHPRSETPILLIPGGSVSGASYETTPDGRPGWQTNFLVAGYSVLVADTAETGRTPPAPVPQILANPPLIRGKKFLWEIFRIGPPGSYGSESSHCPYADSRFPIRAFDMLARQTFPRYRAPPETQSTEYTALLQRACPCVVVAHSGAGPLAERAVLKDPRLAKALVLIEPSGGIGLENSQARRIGLVPHLYLWGDHVDQDAAWQEEYASSHRDFEALRSCGVHVTWIDLPKRGVRGNSHMLMMDDNSEAIARIITGWLSELPKNSAH